MQPAVPREPLHGGQLRPVGLDGEQQAGTRGLAVDEDRARTADAVLATDVRAREPEVFPDEIDQELAGRAPPLARHPIDGEPDVRELAAIHYSLASDGGAPARPRSFHRSARRPSAAHFALPRPAARTTGLAWV